MPKQYRLSVADLKAFRPERRFSGTYFSLAIAPAARIGTACVISKKIAPRAVDRNKVKRRVRSALQRLLPSSREGTYVFYAKKEALDAAYAEVVRDIEKLLARVA